MRTSSSPNSPNPKSLHDLQWVHEVGDRHSLAVLSFVSFVGKRNRLFKPIAQRRLFLLHRAILSFCGSSRFSRTVS
jgi:hypothetical protein